MPIMVKKRKGYWGLETKGSERGGKGASRERHLVVGEGPAPPMLLKRYAKNPW